MPADAGNFGLIDRRVAGEIARLLDRDRYYAGPAQLGRLPPDRRRGRARARGTTAGRASRCSGLWRLAKAPIFSFSSFPLTIFYVIGVAVAGRLRRPGRLHPLPQAVHRPGDPRLDLVTMTPASSAP